jgi:hypothetical protein
MLYTPADQVERAVIESEVALFGIHPKSLALRPIQIYAGTVDVEKLAANSGGFVVHLRRPEGIQAAVESLFQILKTRYTLGFYPASAGKPGSTRHLSIRLKNNQIEAALPGAILRYRKQYRVPTEKK